MTPDPRLAALRALAEKATPNLDERPSVSIAGEYHSMQKHQRALVEFYEAATPAAVIDLLDALSVAEGAGLAVAQQHSRDLTREIERRMTAENERDALAARLAGDRWWLLSENLPSYGQPVWCYWPGRRKGDPGMQGVAVRSIHTPDIGVGSMNIADYWHAEDDKYDTRFTPMAWRTLPPAPSEAGGEGRGTDHV